MLFLNECYVTDRLLWGLFYVILHLCCSAESETIRAHQQQCLGSGHNLSIRLEIIQHKECDCQRVSVNLGLLIEKENHHGPLPLSCSDQFLILLKDPCGFIKQMVLNHNPIYVCVQVCLNTLVRTVAEARVPWSFDSISEGRWLACVCRHVFE